MVSSDWNECLAPCGPFDPLLFVYPQLSKILTSLFRDYTSARISLTEATRQIRDALPRPVTPAQMDAYLEASFQSYKGVPELIEWCRDKGILFMINTTGSMGYFQRVFSKRLLPPVPVLAAHSLIRYPGSESDPPCLLETVEIEDKAQNTACVMERYGIAGEKIILIGDSGGDGPHFQWGRSVGASLFGSMTKHSLEDFCKNEGLTLDARFGLCYPRAALRNREREMQVDFMHLVPVIEKFLRYG